MKQDMSSALEQLKGTFAKQDACSFRQLLDRYPNLKDRINEPLGPFDSPLLISVRKPEMLDVLLDAGADINAKSRWWAGGFGLLHSAIGEILRAHGVPEPTV
jgi:hypothetical protein